MLLRSISRRHTPILFARYRLKGFKAEFVQTLRRALFKSIWTWAHPLYDQKVIKTECFRCDFVMVLDQKVVLVPKPFLLEDQLALKAW